MTSVHADGGQRGINETAPEMDPESVSAIMLPKPKTDFDRMHPENLAPELGLGAPSDPRGLPQHLCKALACGLVDGIQKRHLQIPR